MHQFRLLLVALLAFAAPQSAQAVIIDFDDIATTLCCGTVPSNYQGLTWTGDWIVLTDTAFIGTYGNSFGSPSGENAASNGGGMLTVTVADGANFDFTSASFAGWGSNDEGGIGTSTTITVEGWNDGVLVASTGAQAISAGGYGLVASNIMDIDELRFISSGEDQWWLMDDLTINAPTQVPEPGTVLLMGSGLLGLAFQGRKRRA